MLYIIFISIFTNRLQCVCGTPQRKGMQYSSNKLTIDLYIYSNASYGTSIDQRSITGYIMTLNDTLVTWASRKQKFVSRSSTKAEYKALINSIYKGR